jgi:MoaA/NifB/PqqE/SkfB family radical SAM enzyme
VYLSFPVYKIPLFYIGRRLNSAITLPINVVFVVTSKCNSQCKTCFIWQNQDNRVKELTLAEYRMILQSMGKTYWVTVGGGEPFLREDLLEIVLNICNYLKPKIVNIVSNGTMPEKIFYTVRKLTNLYPNTHFILNLSLDHISEKHDIIRGLEGNFDLVFKTVESLKAIRNSNFSLGIHSVISKYNLNEFPFIYYWIKENMLPDFYIIENAQRREEFMNLEADFFQKPTDYLKAVKFYLDKIKSEKMAGINRLKRAFRIVYYNAVKESLLYKKKPYNCYAGYSSCQINPDGAVWSCATKGFILGELRNHNYDFKGLWLSRKANEMRDKIRQGQCSCHLSNVSYTNILLDPTKLLSVLYNFMRY